MKKDGSLTNTSDIRIFKRNYISSNIDKLIEESVYYRTFSFEMKTEKVSIYNYSEDSGRGKIN